MLSDTQQQLVAAAERVEITTVHKVMEMPVPRETQGQI
jgi:hypothetical protein